MSLGNLLLGITLAWACGRLSACALIPGPNSNMAEVQGIERTTYRSGDAELAALRGGKEGAPRLIFVHGSPGEAESWLDYLRTPLANTEVLAVDRPGYGRTRPRRAIPDLSEQARALEPLLVSQGGRWPVLVGHSLGGPIVLQAAADYPGRVGGVVVIAGSVDPGLEELRWYNYLAKGLAWILPGVLRRSNDEMWDLKSELLQLEAALGQVRCPTWIVHGTRDSLVPVANVEYLQARLADTRTTVLEGAGHFLIWQEEWMPTVRAILAMAMRADQD